MKFIHQPEVPKRTIKTFTKFLFLPLRIGNETRWLEKASWVAIYLHSRNMKRFTWVPSEWVE